MITPKRHNVGCQLLLITNRKSHMGFRLIPTLNDLERRNSLFLRFLTEFDCFADQLCHNGWRQTYNVHKVLSPIYSLPLLAITNPPCSWATCSRYISWHKISGIAQHYSVDFLKFFLRIILTYNNKSVVPTSHTLVSVISICQYFVSLL